MTADTVISSSTYESQTKLWCVCVSIYVLRLFHNFIDILCDFYVNDHELSACNDEK